MSNPDLQEAMQIELFYPDACLNRTSNGAPWTMPCTLPKGHDGECMFQFPRAGMKEKPPMPAWHDAPTVPGWWVACDSDGGLTPICPKTTEDCADVVSVMNAEGWDIVGVYGPIPEYPKEPR